MPGTLSSELVMMPTTVFFQGQTLASLVDDLLRNILKKGKTSEKIS
jgi:hypothetical protein